MRRILPLVFSLFASTVVAQDVAEAPAGEIRVLDKITGAVSQLTLSAGETATVGHLSIQMTECRYPVNNPSGDAFIFLDVTYREEAEPAFQGWMIASAPALSAMEHPRYDVWALRCITS